MKSKNKRSIPGRKGVACEILEFYKGCFMQVSCTKLLVVEKRNLNWAVPKPIADHFDAFVTGRYDKKKKWVGACAAMLMYLSASEDEQRDYEQQAMSAFGSGQAEKVLAKLMQPAKPTPMKKPKGKPLK